MIDNKRTVPIQYRRDSVFWMSGSLVCLSAGISYLILYRFMGAPYFGDDMVTFLGLNHPSHLWGYFFQHTISGHAFRPIEAVILTVIQEKFFLSTIPIHLVSITLHVSLCGILALFLLRMGLHFGEVALSVALTALSPELATTILGNDCMSQALSAVFALLTVYLSFESLQVEGTRPYRSQGLWVLGSLAYGLCILSKETGLGIVAIVVLIAAIISWRKGGSIARLRSLSILACPYLAVIVLYFLARSSAGVTSRGGEGPYSIHLGLNVFKNLALFVIGSMSPASSVQIAIASQSRDIRALILDSVLLFTVVAMLGTALCVSSRKMLYLFATLAALAALFPAIVLSHVSELYLYSAAPYFALILALAFFDVWRSAQRVRVLAVTAMVLVIGGFALSNYRKAWYMDRNGQDETRVRTQLVKYMESAPPGEEIVLVNRRHSVPSYSIYVLDEDVHQLDVDSENARPLYARLSGRSDVRLKVCNAWTGCLPRNSPRELVLELHDGQLMPLKQ